MTVRRRWKRILRCLALLFYPSEEWLHDRHSDRYRRRRWRRYSRFELPGPAYDLAILLLCGLLALAYAVA